MDRRGFLRVCATGATVAVVGARVKTLLAEDAPGATTLPTALPTVTDAGTREGDMLYRRLGKTGEKVSLVGLGGYHLGKVKEEAEAVKIARSAIDRGVTFMDNSWDYNDGRSEEWMGKALADGYRKKVFLMTKIDGRTKESAAKQLDESLKRLGTDHLDLLQFHEVIRLEDPDRIFADGGALDAVLAAKKAGKVRYIGFTGHKDPLVHLRMLKIAADNDFHFDTVQMPLNVLDAHFRSFAHKVLPVLVKEEIGVLCMKSLAAGALLESGAVTATEARHYAMNLPTSVVICGIDSMDRLDEAIDQAKTFKPLTQDQVSAILDKAAKAAAKGKYERFKTTTNHDSTAHSPQWLG